MNELINIKNSILDQLKNFNPYLPNSNRTQHVIRCPYCGDSSNRNHGHLSIKIDTGNEDSTMVYRCFRCDESGLVDKNFLSDIGILLDTDTNVILDSYVKKAYKFNKFTNDTIESYMIPWIPNNKLTECKLKYFNDRIGTNINSNEAKDLKIILDFNSFIKSNDIQLENVKASYIDFINNNYIGFLSMNNNLITFRAINNTASKRYIKFKINQKNMETGTFYSVPNSFDIMYTNNVNVHIAEGTFDILSIYKNIKKEDKEQDFYFASCGFGMLNVLKYIIYRGLNTNINLHIWADNDKSNYDYIKSLGLNYDPISLWIDDIKIHRNMYSNEKDFGVPFDHIEDSMGII